MWKELNTPKRNSDVEDESLWSFIARRFDPDVADNLVDPLFKGIIYLNPNSKSKTLNAIT